MTDKECSQCKDVLPLTTAYFRKNNKQKNGFRPECKLCSFYKDIKWKYDLNREEYLDLYKKQNGRCALCRKNLHLPNRLLKTNIHVDHNHMTGEVRGMLCMNCNVNLGWYLNKKDRVNEYARKK